MRDSMRRLLIDRLLTERKIVTFEELTTLLKASAPTVKRDLRYMREILGAPIVYSRGEYHVFRPIPSGESLPFARILFLEPGS